MIKLTMILVLVACPALSWAQGHAQHVGLAYEGTIQSIRGDSVEVKTDKGPIEISLTPATKFELGMDGKPGVRADLKVGVYVMLTAAKLESGELVAQNIMIHGSNEGAGAVAEPPSGGAHTGHHM